MSRGRVIHFSKHGSYDLEPRRWVGQLLNAAAAAKTSFRVKAMTQPSRQQILVRRMPAITMYCAFKQISLQARTNSKCPDLGNFLIFEAFFL